MTRRNAGPSPFVQLLVACSTLACVASKPAPSEHDVTVQSALGTVSCPNNTSCNPLVQGAGTTGTGLCCAEAFQATCDEGRWPNGNVYYQFHANNTSAQNQMFRLVMNDWEDATNGTIHFIAGSPPPAQGGNPLTVKYAPGGGGGASFNGCHAGACTTTCNEGNAYHELGHTLLNFHYWQRYDRNHYMVIRDILGPAGGGGNACDANTRCPNDGQRDLGPFDFKSTMLYSANYPGHGRYDGSRLCSPAIPDSCDGSVGCAGTAATRYNKCTNPAIACPPGSPPGCITCSNNSQPFGPPTNYDGAAVVELYRNLAEPGWKRFRRTVAEVTSGPGAKQPFNYVLASGVTLSTVDPTPALSFWGASNELSVFVLGSDKHTYFKKKSNSTQVWGSWTDLGCCFNSAPGAVSWGTGRTDVVARGEDNQVYIKTYASGAWTSWQPLEGSTVASAPSITSWGANRLDVFARATNGALMVKSCTANCSAAQGMWTAWSTPFAGGGLKGRPAVVSRGPNLIDIYVHGGDDQLYANWYHNGVAGNWSFVASGPLACARLADGTCDSTKDDQYSPAVGARTDSQIDVFVRGAVTDDDKLSVISWQSGTWGSFKVLGGVLASGPGSISRVRGANRTDVVGVMNEEASFGTPLKSGVWWKEYNP